MPLGPVACSASKLPAESNHALNDYQPYLRRSRHSRAEGTSRSGSERREAPWRLHSCPLAWWQTSGLGRHSVHYSGAHCVQLCTWQPPVNQQEPLPNKLLKESLWNMLNCLQPTNFSQWQLTHLGLWMRLRFLLFLSWAVKFRNTRATRLTVVTFSSESACL